MACDPGYLELYKQGMLTDRAEALGDLLETCSLCPHECGAARLQDERGICGAGWSVDVASASPHFGEEEPLSGTNGSGTIFLSHCCLQCVFCINWDISQGGIGRAVSPEKLGRLMLNLQDQGCHNINLVTPTHYAPQIVRALEWAAHRGLRLPIVYNTHGYEKVEILELLEGIVDIYLPDMKFSDDRMAARYMYSASNYPEMVKQAILEMHRQVGIALPRADGLMERGLMIRHLVMPNHVSGSKEIVRWIADHLPPNTYLNIMSQYAPGHKANLYPDIGRRISRKEYEEVVEYAIACGLTNLDIQGVFEI